MLGRSVEIREIRPTEFEAVGELCVSAYLAGGVVTDHDQYLPTLRDVAARAGDDSAQVLVATTAGRIVGTVTYCPFGSPLTQICRNGEFEFRFLAVAVGQQGNGLATTLIDACENLARATGLTTSIACVTDTNTGAAALLDVELEERRHDAWGEGRCTGTRLQGTQLVEEGDQAGDFLG